MLQELYQGMQQQALLLAYMDQFEMLCGVMLPLVFFLKRRPAPDFVPSDYLYLAGGELVDAADDLDLSRLHRGLNDGL